MQIMNLCLKKYTHAITIQKNNQQPKQINIQRAVIYYLQIVCLMLKKIKYVYYKGDDCIKNFFKDLKVIVTEIIKNEKRKCYH